MEYPIVFLDKDGTLVNDVPYNIDPAKVVLEDGAARGMRLLSEAGYHFVVVTNQSGVARGYFPEEALQGVAEHLEQIIEVAAGAKIDGFYYCPHHPDGVIEKYAVECSCRKPGSGLLHAAAAELGIPLAQSWMVGDILNDVEAGNRAVCRTILIDNGNETEWRTGPFRKPDFTAQNLEEAAAIIINEDRRVRQLNTEQSEGIEGINGGKYSGGE
jgi:D,D-heptose 1,7-bisphosphate phosphatase